LFDPKENAPAFLRAGDRVRFRKISRDEFAAFAEATAAEESSKR
jgi:allophanate hydrolase subunit 1